jgi:hypothetical protein
MQKAALQFYDSDAVYHDHLVYVRGRNDIISNNSFWTQGLSRGEARPFSVNKMPPGASLNHGGEGCYVLCVHHTQSCNWWLLQAAGFSYVYYATAVLVVRQSDGKVRLGSWVVCALKTAMVATKRVKHQITFKGLIGVYDVGILPYE